MEGKHVFWHRNLLGFLGVVGLSCALVFGLSSCGSNGQKIEDKADENTASSDTQNSSYTSQIDESIYDLDYTDRDKNPAFDESQATSIQLKGTTAEADGKGVQIKDSQITIEEEGVYILSGTLDDGQLIVNAPDDAKVQLVLNNANLISGSGEALLVNQADKCFITLPKESSNSISDQSNSAKAGSELEAIVYSKCDLTLQGEGDLKVTCSQADGIKTKDDLVITGGNYTVEAASDALDGYDSIKIADGSFNLKSGNDALKSSKDDDETKGFISIDGGTFTIESQDKGINCETYARLAGGSLKINAEDDTVHSENFARLAASNLTLNSGDDAVHAEYILEVDTGDIAVEKCVEGYEAQAVTINGGTHQIISSDDAINASTAGDSSSSSDTQATGNTDQDNPGTDLHQNQPEAPQGAQTPNNQEPSSTGQTPPEPPADAQNNGLPGNDQNGGGPDADADENCVITFNGGTVTIDAEGDGIDSNGYVYVNGGTVYISGPTNDSNASLDYSLSAEINDGTIIAAGSQGMAEGFTGGKQASALVDVSGASGELIQVKNSQGEVLAEYTPTKQFQCVVVSCPGLSESESSVLSINGSETSFNASTSSNTKRPH